MVASVTDLGCTDDSGCVGLAAVPCHPPTRLVHRHQLQQCHTSSHDMSDRWTDMSQLWRHCYDMSDSWNDMSLLWHVREVNWHVITMTHQAHELVYHCYDMSKYYYVCFNWSFLVHNAKANYKNTLHFMNRFNSNVQCLRWFCSSPRATIKLRALWLYKHWRHWRCQ